ncbi:MAG TPA: GGDEF domain-containing protein [Clostridiaceae bacterium]|nr:GGDEF domain-containing protein [Clostridiaceae bacterium]
MKKKKPFFRFHEILTKLREFLFLSIQDKYKREFDIETARVNLGRAKITSLCFLVVEIIMLAVFLSVKGKNFLRLPDRYYGIMYITMIIAMVFYLTLYIRLGKDVQKYCTNIQIAGTSFVIFILSWCAGISLLDQLTYNGQIIVYTVAVLAVAVTPFYKPFILLAAYTVTHALFIALMPLFQKSGGILFGNYVNSTIFIIISWVISYMRYRNRIEDFIKSKEIQEKNDELERLNKELEKLSYIDYLTGISNRTMFDIIVKEEWNRCKHQHEPFSLIILDIDFFKEYNDNYGHRAGDSCIKKIAEVLSNFAERSHFTVARYGGDEFAILLPYTDKEKAFSFAEDTRRDVEKLNIEHAYSSAADHVTISLGVNTIIPSDESSIEEFFDTADKALYKAKENDRNCIFMIN